MNQISNPEDRKKIKNALQEISGSMTRIEAERDLIKEIVNDVVDNFKLPKKYVNKMARIWHKQNFQTEKQESEEFENLYITVVNPPQ
jgi:replication initiation and membrane attachment protein DnaB